MKELMKQFCISEPAVRKQLNELIRQDFVRERTVKKELGRPYYIYELTGKGHQTFPNQYEALPMELLQDLEASQGEEAVQELLRTRKAREEREMKKELKADPFKQRVRNMIKYQEEKGYMVDARETEDGDFEIINYNCPIYNLASNYTIVCEHEKEIYTDLFPGSRVQSHACMTTGENCCCWTISHPKNEEESKG